MPGCKCNIVGDGGNSALNDVVSSDAVIADNAIVRGDGGARKIQDSAPTISDAGNIDLKSGGLEDDNTSSAIVLSDGSNPAFNTTNKTITGSVNENKAEIDFLKGVGSYTTKTDPVTDAISVSDVDDFLGCVITLTAAGNDQNLPNPTDTARYHYFTVINNDTSADNIDIIGSATRTLEPGESVKFVWDGSAWVASDDSGIWFDDGTDVKTQNSSRNIDIQNGGLKDNDVTTAIALGEAGETSFDTTKKSITGAVNELNGKLPNAVENAFTPTLGQTVFTLSSTPSGAAAFSLYLNGQLKEVGTDYTQVGTTLTWLDPVTPSAPGGLTLLTTDRLIARYNDTALGGTKYITFSVNPGSNRDNQRVRAILSTASFNFTFLIPYDFQNLVSLEIFGVPQSGAGGPGKDIDLASNYYGVGEPNNQHSESDTGTVYDTGTDNYGMKLDLSTVFNSLSAGDSCGVNIDHNGLTGPIEYTQILLGYT